MRGNISHEVLIQVYRYGNTSKGSACVRLNRCVKNRNCFETNTEIKSFVVVVVQYETGTKLSKRDVLETGT